MKNKMPMKFTLSRPHGGGANGSIRFTVECEKSSVQFLELTISAEDWVSAQFGMAAVSALGEIRGIDAVGKQKISELRSVVCPMHTYEKDQLRAWLVEHCKEPGWTLDTYLGSQSSIVYQHDGTVRINYRVYKWID